MSILQHLILAVLSLLLEEVSMGTGAAMQRIEKTLSVKSIYLPTLPLRTELSGTIPHGMAQSFIHSYYW